MSNTIDADADVIDSRDVIARIEELESELETAHEAATDAGETTLDFDEWQEAVFADASPAHYHEYHAEVEELRELRALAEQGENASDWQYGETLIAEGYFTDYIEQQIDDGYQLPKEMKSGNWPWRHMTLDYEAAAEEAKVDYDEVTFWGRTFLIRM